MLISPRPAVSNESRVTLGIQLGWGSFTSRVSSRDTIFDMGGMNREMAFRAVVLPDAVPPAKMADLPPSTQSQMYAMASGEKVCHSIRSVGVRGSSLNLRMVKVEPCAVTSWPRVIWIREPSCMVASRIGSAIEMYLPARCASFVTNESSSSAVEYDAEDFMDS